MRTPLLTYPPFLGHRILPDTFIDNDVIFKTCVYDLSDRIAEALNRAPNDIGILSSAIFVLAPILERHGIDQSSINLFRSSTIIEPTDAEIKIAADIEEEALRRNLEVDYGESILVSVVASRGERLVTGDKRAIRGLSSLSSHSDPCARLRRRIVTMEATIAALLATCDVALVRKSVCDSPKTDLAVSACFVCHQETCAVEDVLAALSSYQKSLSSDTGGYVDSDLSA